MKPSRVPLPSEPRIPCPSNACAGSARVYPDHITCDGMFCHTYRRRLLTVELARKIDNGEDA